MRQPTACGRLAWRGRPRSPQASGRGRPPPPRGGGGPRAPPRPAPARLQAWEEATARELRLRAGAHLPLRTYRDLDAREGADPLLGVLSVLADLPAGLRVLWQLALWPADPR